MATKGKISLYQRIKYGLLSVAITVAGSLTFASTTIMMSASHVEAAAAKCAILDQGPVNCPPTITGGGCWYKDLGAPDAGPKKDGWVQASSCDNGIFQAASCPAGQQSCQVQPSEDPALQKCTAGNCDLVKTYVDPLINVLAAGVGVAVTISIVIGGIQYSSSAGDPSKMQAARTRIMNALIALIGFFLFYAVLQWLVPGGLLNG